MNNVPQKLITVKLHNGRIYFSKSDSLALINSNLPMEHISLSERTIYWTLSLLGYDHQKYSLQCEIMDYDAINSESWQGKIPKYPINEIVFVSLDWDHFKNCLSFYDGHARVKIGALLSKKIKKDIQHIKVVHRINLRNLQIHAGYLSYHKKVKWEVDPVEIKIPHADMFPKLDFVKPYFAKILGKQTVEIEVTFGREMGQTTYITAKSQDLQKINRESLYIIKNYQLENYKRKWKQEIGDNILGEAPAFDDSALVFGNIDNLERELLFSLLENPSILNRKQLQYLAEVMKAGYRLMVTVDPQFGFVFTLKGEEMIHCAWELINSHATYLWSFPVKDLSSKEIKILEHEFAIITSHGRSHYRHQFQNREDLYFQVINHKRKPNPIVDAFAEWRLKLDSLII